MPPIINAQEISKAFGASPLFQNVSFTVSEGDRIGLIGPNGSGKSTLLRILAGEMDADSGEVSTRKRARMSYVVSSNVFQHLSARQRTRYYSDAHALLHAGGLFIFNLNESKNIFALSSSSSFSVGLAIIAEC